MRVLFIHPNNRVTGQELSLLARMEGLVAAGVECFCLLPGEGELAGRMREKGVSLKFFPLDRLAKGRVWPYGRTVWRIFRLLQNERIQIVHCSGMYPHQYAWPAARLARVPIVVHVTTDAYQAYDFRVNFLARADLIITCSAVIRARILQDLPKCGDKIKCVYDGIVGPCPAIERPAVEALRRSYGISSGTKVVAQIAEVIPRKGAEYFIEMAALVRNRYPSVKFLLIGKNYGDQYEQDLRAQIKRLGLEKDVIFAGFRPDMALQIALLDVSVLASLAEGLARVIVETQFMGKPIVATDVSGNREAIVDGVTGFLVPPRDPATLAQAVLSLLTDPAKAAQVGNNGRQLAAEKFGIDVHARQVKTIYEQLLKRD